MVESGEFHEFHPVRSTRESSTSTQHWKAHWAAFSIVLFFICRLVPNKFFCAIIHRANNGPVVVRSTSLLVGFSLWRPTTTRWPAMVADCLHSGMGAFDSSGAMTWMTWIWFNPFNDLLSSWLVGWKKKTKCFQPMKSRKLGKRNFIFLCLIIVIIIMIFLLRCQFSNNDGRYFSAAFLDGRTPRRQRFGWPANDGPLPGRWLSKT